MCRDNLELSRINTKMLSYKSCEHTHDVITEYCDYLNRVGIVILNEY